MVDAKKQQQQHQLNKGTMKKITTLLFTALFAFVAYSTAEAQFKLGAGLTYGSGVLEGSGSDDWQNDLGLTVDGYYSISREITAVAGFTYSLPKDEGGRTITVWELNFNGNYAFINDEEMMVYALAGLNITGISSEFDGGGDSSDSETGLNLGAGIEYVMSFGDLFGEAKMANVGGDADQFVVGVGVRFPLGGN